MRPSEWFERVLQAALQILIVGILVCKYISLSVDDPTRQNRIGVVMVCILMGMMLISVGVAVYSFLCMSKEVLRCRFGSPRHPQKNNTLSISSSRTQHVLKMVSGHTVLKNLSLSNNLQPAISLPGKLVAKPRLIVMRSSSTKRLGLGSRHSIAPMSLKTASRSSSNSMRRPSVQFKAEAGDT